MENLVLNDVLIRPAKYCPFCKSFLEYRVIHKIKIYECLNTRCKMFTFRFVLLVAKELRVNKGVYQ